MTPPGSTHGARIMPRMRRPRRRTVHPFAEVVKGLRESLGITQTRLAQRAGIAQSTLGRFEAGNGTVTLDTFEILLDHLGYEMLIKPKART